MGAHPARSAAQNRLLNALLARVEEWAGRTVTLSGLGKATVSSVAAGGASDGTALCTITWLGTDVAAPYLSSYTPVAGHVVAVVRTGPQLLIIGRIVGTP
jgi:hypothetical protein